MCVPIQIMQYTSKLAQAKNMLCEYTAEIEDYKILACRAHSIDYAHRGVKFLPSCVWVKWISSNFKMNLLLRVSRTLGYLISFVCLVSEKPTSFSINGYMLMWSVKIEPTLTLLRINLQTNWYVDLMGQ